MSLNYRNPTSSISLDVPNSVGLDDNFGTNFSVSQIGGYMEVYTLSDLELTLTGVSDGDVLLSANTIPISYNIGGTVPFPPFNLPNTIKLFKDGISSGRRRLGMLVYVHETDQVYQYHIPNYDDLWDDIDSSDLADNSDDWIVTATAANTGSTAFVNAWTGSTIEGQNGGNKRER